MVPLRNHKLSLVQPQKKNLSGANISELAVSQMGQKGQDMVQRIVFSLQIEYDFKWNFGALQETWVKETETRAAVMKCPVALPAAERSRYGPLITGNAL